MAESAHSALTTTNLHVPGYRQDSDPGAVGAGKYWIDSSGGTGTWILKIRNAVDSGWETLASSSAGQVATLCFVIDGGGSTITTGIKGDVVVDFACTIMSATLLADQTGSIVVDIWVDVFGSYPPTDADSITSATPPTISSSISSQDTTLSSWDTSIAAGQTLRFNVDSVTSVQRVTLALKLSRT